VTMSIVARSDGGASFGVAIASSSPAVAARCSHARPGVGAVASQNVTNPALGPAVLNELQRQMGASAALDRVIASEPHRDYRQLLAVGCSGRPAIRSGSKALGQHAEALGQDSAAAGNLLARTTVPNAMVQAFEEAKGCFALRLLMALQAGLEQGGEAGPLHSAGILVVRGDVAWPIVDLRVDWTNDDPIASLTAAWNAYRPQVEDYIRRALDPAGAPSYSVPGDP
jgi:uncharacterized Ntn-hydrolase superfamily protein